MPAPASIVWFRHDLRLDDNPALQAADEAGGPIVPVFLWAPEEEGNWPPGAASRWWLHQSLRSLKDDLARRDLRLIIGRGPTDETLLGLAEGTGAENVFWNRRYEPAVAQRDARLAETLRREGLHTASFNGSLLYEPWEVATKEGRPYQVFSPFWKRCREERPPEEPRGAPRKLRVPRTWPSSLTPDDLELEPEIDWAGRLWKHWTPGTTGAKRRLKRFLERGLAHYRRDRERPDRPGTSCLSPHLHFGEISPRRVWHAVLGECGDPEHPGPDAETFLSELGWREFAHHVLHHFPKTADRPLKPQFARFPWRRDKRLLRAWQRGETGYPIVDAGMRQLSEIGWMHNRVRMIVGSFLTKDLLISWREGAAWFWDTLVDADLANNTLGWQWVGGCGADAAPYFRVFNPVTQSRKFDPDGEYLRRWIPELSEVPGEDVHAPWEADEQGLHEAGVALGEDYPRPIVDHKEARREALEAFAAVRKS